MIEFVRIMFLGNYKRSDSSYSFGNNRVRDLRLTKDQPVIAQSHLISQLFEVELNLKSTF